MHHSNDATTNVITKFYSGSVRNALDVITNTNTGIMRGYFLVTWAGSNPDEAGQRVPAAPEVSLCASLFFRLRTLFNPEVSIIVLCFYKEQMKTLLRHGIKKIHLSTVDAFQGGQRDIVILSTGAWYPMGFLIDRCGINVATSRAKSLLIFVMNDSFGLGTVKPNSVTSYNWYRAFLSYLHGFFRVCCIGDLDGCSIVKATDKVLNFIGTSGQIPVDIITKKRTESSHRALLQVFDNYQVNRVGGLSYALNSMLWSSQLHLTSSELVKCFEFNALEL